MYKKQMTAQKILCIVAILASVCVFLYALGIMTDLYDCLYDTMRNPRDVYSTDVEGSIVYYNMQEFNQYFLIYSIAHILLAAFLFLTNTNIRRRYYIGNYAAIGLYSVASVALTIFGHHYIQIFRGQFLQIDFAALKEHAEMWNTAYTDSTFWFDLHYAVFAFILIVSVLLIANAVWKMNLMKEEAQLIEQGRRAAA